jgi:hypothetical protein
MPRSGRLCNFIREYNESPKAEKLSFIPPFIILFIEIILLYHAISVNETFVIILTLILLVISIIEIVLVTFEIHENRSRNVFERRLTIKLDDFIIERREKNVKKIIEKFIDNYPEYQPHRTDAYHIACQIMETHREELWEKTLKTRMKRFVTKNKIKTVKDLMDHFIDRYPEYNKNPGKVYRVAAYLLDQQQRKMETKELNKKKKS